MSDRKIKKKSELMAELEKDIEVIQKHFADCEIVDHLYEPEVFLRVKFELEDGYSYASGRRFEYLPDPVAPAKWEPVFDVFGNRYFSKGCFHTSGNGLMVLVGDLVQCLEYWCCVNNRDHYSPGWRKEWEPEE